MNEKDSFTSFVCRMVLPGFLMMCLTLPAFAQKTRTLAEQLGYEKNARLLIVHADDIGLSSSVNRASFDALVSGAVSSGSIMVPCPWFYEAAEKARLHPELDLGLHLTLTAEWKTYRWDGVSSGDGPSATLHDSLGYLHAAGDAITRVDVAEAEKEIRAQIERAIAFGIKPTHLDSHMGTLYASGELFGLFLKMAREYRLPVFLPRESLSQFPAGTENQLPSNVILLDRLAMATPDVPADQWVSYYTDVIETLKPGLTELIVHLAYDDEEMRGISTGHEDYGSAWRQRDYDFVKSDTFKSLLAKTGVRLVTWREIGRLIPE